MKGLAFPIRLSGSGGLKMSEGVRHTSDTLSILLNTKKFERTMNPDLGNTLDANIFEDNDVSMESLLKYEICNILQEEGMGVTEKDIKIYRENEIVKAIVETEDGSVNVKLT